MAGIDLLDAAFPGDDKPVGATIQLSDQHAVEFSDDYPRRQTAVRCEQRLGGVLRAAWVAVPTEMSKDAASLSMVIAGAFDRVLRPWRFADRNPMPIFQPFPWLALGSTLVDRLRRRVAR